jgi:subtilisin family serine protease
MRSRATPLLTVLVLCSGVAYAQSEPSWTQLSLSTCKVDEFLAAHPESDGRGVVIAIFDTGVDPSIPGLTRLPDGAVKVIDVQDFTGQGDIELHRVRIDEQEGKLVDYDEGSPIYYALPDLPDAGAEARRFWFGTLDEHRFINADVPDLNDNGSTEDEWTVLVTALEGDGDDQALFFIDRNLDRSFADERPLRNYKLAYDTFTLHRDQPEQQIVPFNFAVNIFLRQATVVVHWDDGAHGTHVAGIAAGYRINDQDGFNGVAPGARLMSCKIGQNAVGGISVTESMKKAFEYVGRYAREHGVPVVCNMSYGVESEIEGNSDIDRFVDDFLRENPYVIFCTSAGNEGPGLSSVGTPAAAYHAISVGAMMAADTGRDVAGYHQTKPTVTPFSSRGGELAKPNVATPGWSSSTVPRFVTRGDFWAGTSMASPYAAGLCAVLISDAMQKHPGAPVRAWDVRRALELSGRPVSGMSELDYGWGVPDLPKAGGILDRLVPLAADDPVIGYDISTPCPQGYKGSAPAAYWRGVWFPSGEERQTFTIKPIFAPAVDAAARTAFTRKFDLRSNAKWLKLPQETTYLRSEQSARVFVEYDANLLAQPGLYVGTVDAIADGRVAFRLVNTVIVPHRATLDADFTLAFEDQQVNGWIPNRHFVSVPAGASAMKLTLSAPEDEVSKARLEYVFDPGGHGYRVRGSQLDPDGGRREIVRTFTDDLRPGVWEVPIIADKPDKQWPYDFEVQFFGLSADPPKITEWSGGSKPSGELTVTNMFEKRVVADADGLVEGFRKHKEDHFEGLNHTLEYSLRLDEGFDRVRIHLEMTPEAYATTTDIGVMIKDGSGEAVYSSAFSNRELEATVRASGSLTLVITGGFAVADDKRETPITVDIDHLLAEPVAIEVGRNGQSPVNFVPGVPIPLDVKVQKSLNDKPKGTHPVGYLRFRERYSHDEVLRVPIEIEG